MMTVRENYEKWWRHAIGTCSTVTLEDAFKAAYAAGQESMRDKLDQQWNAGFDAGKAAGRKAGLEEAAVKCIELMKQYRFDKHTHEGLGDIRLTIGAQEEIAAAIRALKAG